MRFLITLVTLSIFAALSTFNLTSAPTNTAPVRTVSGQILTSTELPAVRLKFEEQFKYVGSQSFVLYNVANAEQHFFVNAEKDGRIRSLYWVQFEGYLPNNTHSYDYKSTKVVNLGGFDFIADAYPRNIKANPGRPESDGSRARAFLETKGYRMGSDQTLSQRLVHLVDEAKRNELMIIYLEDLSRLGFSAADLAPGGRAEGEWERVSKELLARATSNMVLSK